MDLIGTAAELRRDDIGETGDAGSSLGKGGGTCGEAQLLAIKSLPVCIDVSGSFALFIDFVYGPKFGGAGSARYASPSTRLEPSCQLSRVAFNCCFFASASFWFRPAEIPDTACGGPARSVEGSALTYSSRLRMFALEVLRRGMLLASLKCRTGFVHSGDEDSPKCSGCTSSATIKSS